MSLTFPQFVQSTDGQINAQFVQHYAETFHMTRDEAISAIALNILDRFSPYARNYLKLVPAVQQQVQKDYEILTAVREVPDIEKCSRTMLSGAAVALRDTEKSLIKRALVSGKVTRAFPHCTLGGTQSDFLPADVASQLMRVLRGEQDEWNEETLSQLYFKEIAYYEKEKPIYWMQMVRLWGETTGQINRVENLEKALYCGKLISNFTVTSPKHSRPSRIDFADDFYPRIIKQYTAFVGDLPKSVTASLRKELEEDDHFRRNFVLCLAFPEKLESLLSTEGELPGRIWLTRLHWMKAFECHFQCELKQKETLRSWIVYAKSLPLIEKVPGEKRNLTKHIEAIQKLEGVFNQDLKKVAFDLLMRLKHRDGEKVDREMNESHIPLLTWFEGIWPLSDVDRIAILTSPLPSINKCRQKALATFEEISHRCDLKGFEAYFLFCRLSLLGDEEIQKRRCFLRDFEQFINGKISGGGLAELFREGLDLKRLQKYFQSFQRLRSQFIGEYFDKEKLPEEFLQEIVRHRGELLGNSDLFHQEYAHLLTSSLLYINPENSVPAMMDGEVLEEVFSSGTKGIVYPVLGRRFIVGRWVTNRQRAAYEMQLIDRDKGESRGLFIGSPISSSDLLAWIKSLKGYAASCCDESQPVVPPLLNPRRQKYAALLEAFFRKCRVGLRLMMLRYSSGEDQLSCNSSLRNVDIKSLLDGHFRVAISPPLPREVLAGKALTTEDFPPHEIETDGVLPFTATFLQKGTTVEKKVRLTIIEERTYSDVIFTIDQETELRSRYPKEELNVQILLNQFAQLKARVAIEGWEGT